MSGRLTSFDIIYITFCKIFCNSGPLGRFPGSWRSCPGIRTFIPKVNSEADAPISGWRATRLPSRTKGKWSIHLLLCFSPMSTRAAFNESFSPLCWRSSMPMDSGRYKAEYLTLILQILQIWYNIKY